MLNGPRYRLAFLAQKRGSEVGLSETVIGKKLDIVLDYGHLPVSHNLKVFLRSDWSSTARCRAES
jgi:hypothetical protein